MNSRKHGFTLIELTLVLGIAGLIFAMAFIALPNLWASERDAERRTAVMDFISSLKNYESNNNRGAMPILDTSNDRPAQFTLAEARNASAETNTNNWQAFVRDYIDKDLSDPSASAESTKFYVVQCRDIDGTQLGVSKPCLFGGKSDDGTELYQELAKANADGGPTVGIDYTFYVGIGATCDGDRLVKSSSSRSVAVIYLLERSGRYCYST